MSLRSVRFAATLLALLLPRLLPVVAATLILAPSAPAQQTYTPQSASSLSVTFSVERVAAGVSSSGSGNGPRLVRAVGLSPKASTSGRGVT